MRHRKISLKSSFIFPEVNFTMLAILFSTLMFSLSTQAVLLKRLSSCDQSFSSLSYFKIQDHQKLTEFPKGLFLAREVLHTIESNGDLVYKTHKKMLHESDPETETCYFGKPAMVFKSQALLPVLIDLTDLKKVGDAYWKFSLDIENKVGSAKSQRSLVKVSDLYDRLAEQGFDVEKIQISHDEFELRLKRVNSQSTELYVVLFDRKLTSP